MKGKFVYREYEISPEDYIFQQDTEIYFERHAVCAWSQIWYTLSLHDHLRDILREAPSESVTRAIYILPITNRWLFTYTYLRIIMKSTFKSHFFSRYNCSIHERHYEFILKSTLFCWIKTRLSSLLVITWLTQSSYSLHTCNGTKSEVLLLGSRQDARIVWRQLNLWSYLGIF